jgi:pseudaminic acid synthase
MIRIGNRIISHKRSPFLIAEISANHKGSFKRALKLIKLAAQSGFDAIKLQTYEPDSITLNSRRRDFLINDKKSIWNKKRLYELYKEGHTPKEWHKKLFTEAKKLKLIAFSTPFDLKSVDFLNELNVPCFKISSFEITYLDLIKKCARTKKPLIISTGLATLEEIKEAVNAAKSCGCKKIILLKCSSNYPANPKDINLITLLDLKKRFKTEVGLSDHTLGSEIAISSISYGATVIEKHITIKNDDGALDSKFALDSINMKNFVKGIKNTYLAKGQVKYGPTNNETKSLKFRRSIYVSKVIKAGERISNSNIKIIRPSLGLNIKHYPKVIGLKAKKKLKPGDRIKLINLVTK